MIFIGLDNLERPLSVAWIMCQTLGDRVKTGPQNSPSSSVVIHIIRLSRKYLKTNSIWVGAGQKDAG